MAAGDTAADGPAPGGAAAATKIAEINRRLGEVQARRTALMRTLRALQAQHSAAPSPVSFIDMADARLTLKRVLDEWRDLLARLQRIEGWAPLGSEPPVFAEVTHGTNWTAARALVPMTPDSLLFVHGPVTVWHAARLAEEMLREDDPLIRLDRVAFHRELPCEPRILASEEGLSDPDAVDRADIAVEGVLVSAAGRRIRFIATAADGATPTRRAGWHPLAAQIIAARPVKFDYPTAFSLRLPTSPPTALSATRASDVMLAKMEAVLGVFTQHIRVGERVFLLSRGLNMAVEPDIADWLATAPEIAFELDWVRARAIPGNGRFVPARYRITPDDARWHKTMFVCLDGHLDFQA